jgi:two-component system, sensor histidine kinase and response regulator
MDTAQPNILLVEDNPINQKVEIALLKKLGCRVTLAENGRQALETLQQANFDLIFMDCQMPVMDGYEATVHIRNEEHSRHIPIIAVTAHALEGEREKCLAVGMDDYLPKPVTNSDFRRMLERWYVARSAIESRNEEPGLSTGRIDFTVWNSIRELQDGLLKELFEIFLQDTPMRLEIISDAITQQDAVALQQSAHTLKGSGGNIGAVHMSEICAFLVELGKTDSFENADRLYGDLQQEYARVRNSIETELASLSAR